MAIKDWKLLFDDSESGIGYRKKDKTLNVFNSYFYTDKNLWEMSVTKNSRKIVKKHFKTKSQALKYAKAYMRKH